MLVSKRIRIAGQVQGVGFRPFVYNLALQFDLKGYVSNDERGVIVCVQGNEEHVDRFYRDLIQQPPPLSRIRSHSIEDYEAENLKSFEIKTSRKGGPLNLQLTPDFGICETCKKEISDKENRRYGYPFTTCVNCGPRWSLTRNFPFERENTSLAGFAMCPECSEEYADPSNRRFHSQTNSCSTCGISLKLFNSKGELLDVPDSDLCVEISRLLKEGKIIAIKNTGGYLLCCDADNAETVNMLRGRKKRPAKPFALMYPSLEVLEHELSLNVAQREALTSVPRPIVIIPFKEYRGELAIEAIAPGLRQLGVMLPYSGLLEFLARELTRPIVATSGNLHGSPILSNQQEARRILDGVADYFVHHDLPIENPQDDSVVKISEQLSTPIMFRRSRGYAPNFFDFKSDTSECIMAMGSQLKSTIAFLPNSYLYQSQYLGNLDSFDVYERFDNSLEGLIRIFEREPSIILVDGHPEYLSTKRGIEYAEEIGANCFEIQHHMAHFASVLGEHELLLSNEPVLGVIWDGTGFGSDKQIWGGEFFLYQDKAMKRWRHFDYFEWIAGDKMAKEPRLSLLALSDDSMLEDVSDKFSKEEKRVYLSLLEKKRLKTSSVGRLFDAAASLLGLCDYNSYEGEAAILLENHVETDNFQACSSFFKSGEKELLSPHAIILKMHRELQKGRDTRTLALNFLFTLASIVKEQAIQSGVNKVAFSGGVFQNSILVEMIQEMLQGEFETYFNVNLAPNDENIAHGQMMYHLYEVQPDTDSEANSLRHSKSRV